MNRYARTALLIAVLFLWGCTAEERVEIRKLSGDEAVEACGRKGVIIVDVRREDEYASGHLPNAVNIPVESITEAPKELPDRKATVIVYCRSGRRSAEAAEKLRRMGYSDIIDIGGIIDWEGDIEY